MKNDNELDIANRHAGETEHEEFWRALSTAGNGQLRVLRGELKTIAPKPGTVVLLQARQLHLPSSSFDSILLSAIDACTHLQVARMYFISSLAATIDFLEFLVGAFPFPIREIKTFDSADPANEQARQLEHRFTLAAHRCGIPHSVLNRSDHDALIFLEKYFYPSIDTASAQEKRSDQQSAQLRQFLFFHNNHRSLPTLDGRIPVEALRAFPQFRRSTSFDPT